MSTSEQIVMPEVAAIQKEEVTPRRFNRLETMKDFIRNAAVRLEGKEYWFHQHDNVWYSRESGRYIDEEEMWEEILDDIGWED